MIDIVDFKQKLRENILDVEITRQSHKEYRVCTLNPSLIPEGPQVDRLERESPGPMLFVFNVVTKRIEPIRVEFITQYTVRE